MVKVFPPRGKFARCVEAAVGGLIVDEILLKFREQRLYQQQQYQRWVRAQAYARSCGFEAKEQDVEVEVDEDGADDVNDVDAVEDDDVITPLSRFPNATVHRDQRAFAGRVEPVEREFLHRRVQREREETMRLYDNAVAVANL